jgi:Gram-negative bacterial TonB protein C-terminal
VRGWLIESGSRPVMSPIALLTSITVWGASFYVIAWQHAENKRAIADPSPSEHVRFVLPTNPREDADPLGGLTYGTGMGQSAPKKGAGGMGSGGNARRAKPQQPAPLPPDLPPGTGGEVYVESEVDTPVERDPTSAAPAYPEYLEEIHVEGFVIAEYVVDTTGVADSTSLHVEVATHPAFVESLRAALPHMHFTPATLNGQKVREKVRQEFLFQLGPIPAPSKTTT